jgi:DNA-binding NarL/FixJ family response regulator
MILLSPRIAPDVRSRHEGWLAYDLEKGFSDLESRRRRATGITRLTRREQQLVNLLLEGCDNVEIAKQLRIAHRTVKACFSRLYLRFGITSGIKRVKLATLVYRNQLSSDAILTESSKEFGRDPYGKQQGI